jgi:hypothetical protein
MIIYLKNLVYSSNNNLSHLQTHQYYNLNAKSYRDGIFLKIEYVLLHLIIYL